MKTDKVYNSTEFDMMMINGMDVERGFASVYVYTM